MQDHPPALHLPETFLPPLPCTDQGARLEAHVASWHHTHDRTHFLVLPAGHTWPLHRWPPHLTCTMATLPWPYHPGHHTMATTPWPHPPGHTWPPHTGHHTLATTPCEHLYPGQYNMANTPRPLQDGQYTLRRFPQRSAPPPLDTLAAALPHRARPRTVAPTYIYIDIYVYI